VKYYIWLDTDEKPLSRAWRYEDETERMAAETHPPSPGAVLRAGTREQLKERFGLDEVDSPTLERPSSRLPYLCHPAWRTSRR
jgi:hypothetical protein